MIVDSKMIQKAKEKLGDRNADLIAELLNVSKWDARNKKGCCPFHTENTPSFIYNPKSYNFHCFGCGANADYIDALVHNGKSYLEACQLLFQEAEIDYPLNENLVLLERGINRSIQNRSAEKPDAYRNSRFISVGELSDQVGTWSLEKVIARRKANTALLSEFLLS